MEKIVMEHIPKHGGVYMTRAEQETIITIGALDTVANICSNDPSYWRKLDKKCEEHPDEYKLTKIHRTKDGLILCKWYEVPRKLVRFGVPRVYTEEQREQAAERFRQYRKAKANS